MYTPESPGSINSFDQLKEYIERELNRVGAAIEASNRVPTVAVVPSKPREGDVYIADGTNWNPGSGAGTYIFEGGVWSLLTTKAGSLAIIIKVTNEFDVITTGTAKITFRMPFAFKVLAVRASLKTAGGGSSQFDINENGTSILGTKLTIDASEKTSTTAATPATITDADLADDAEMTVDIDTAGSNAVGAVVYLIGNKA